MLYNLFFYHFNKFCNKKIIKNLKIFNNILIIIHTYLCIIKFMKASMRGHDVSASSKEQAPSSCQQYIHQPEGAVFNLFSIKK